MYRNDKVILAQAGSRHFCVCRVLKACGMKLFHNLAEAERKLLVDHLTKPATNLGQIPNGSPSTVQHRVSGFSSRLREPLLWLSGDVERVLASKRGSSRLPQRDLQPPAWKVSLQWLPHPFFINPRVPFAGLDLGEWGHFCLKTKVVENEDSCLGS